MHTIYETCCVIVHHRCTVSMCTVCMLQGKQLCWKVCRMALRWLSQAQEWALQSQLGRPLGRPIYILQLAPSTAGLPNQGRLLQQCQAKYIWQQRWWTSLMMIMTLSLFSRSCGHDMLAGCTDKGRSAAASEFTRPVDILGFSHLQRILHP